MSAPEVSYSDGFYASNDGLALYYRLYTPYLPDIESPDIKSSASVSSRLKPEGSGSRKTILCLPGVSRNHRDFLPLIGQLSANMNWLLVDLRGRGHSAHDPNPANYNPATYVADICSLLDHLDLESVDIIGTSLGGILSMMLNTQHPQRVGRVVLNDIGAFVEREAVANIGSYLRQAHQHTSWDSVVAAIKPVYSDFFTDLAEEDWHALARRLYRQRPDATFAPDYDPELFSNGEATDLDLWPFFNTLKGKPTLLIRGANSSLLTPSILTQMTASRSDLKTATVPNRGHAPFLDEPVAVAAIRAFFATA